MSGGPAPAVATLAPHVGAIAAGRLCPVAVDAVDAALHDALVAIERRLDGPAPPDPAVREVLAGSFELLDGFRHHRWAPAETRIRAGHVLSHVVAHLDADGPLARIVAALAMMPAEDEAARFDPAPDPQVPLEQAVVDALGDPAMRPRLLRALADHAVILPVLAVEAAGPKAAVRFAAVERAGRPAVAAYTSEARFRAHCTAAGVEVEAMVLAGGALAGAVPPGHGLVLNPGSVVGVGISAAELRRLANDLDGG